MRSLQTQDAYSALQTWELIESQDDGRYKVTEGMGSAAERAIPTGPWSFMQAVIRRIAPYLAVVERAAHRREDAS